MSFLVKMLVAIAALVLAANAGLELLQRFGIAEEQLATYLEDDAGKAEKSSTDVFQYGLFVGDAAEANFSVAQPEDIEIEVQFKSSGEDTVFRELRYIRAFIPIRADTKHSSRIWRSTYGRFAAWESKGRPETGAVRYANGFPVWDCQSATYSSLLIYDFETEETKSVVPDGYAVTSFVFNQTRQDDNGGEGALVVGTYVSEDANKDGVLNCNDPEKIFIIRTGNGEFVSVDAGGQPFFAASSMFHYDGDDPGLMSIGLDENGDGVYDPYTEMVVPARLDFKTNEVTRISGGE